ncbi:unnamed protein product [Heligmosomoides polygyrus]|uniref:Uncharacterized protein n=1 Tax=Heligmosomoides polygyrus TaxID=6339 RepID=A0A183FE17_HELPZ|nr:unnamed protein product [Heligmosomoides polygyrus]
MPSPLAASKTRVCVSCVPYFAARLQPFAAKVCGDLKMIGCRVHLGRDFTKRWGESSRTRIAEPNFEKVGEIEQLEKMTTKYDP